MIGLVMFHLLVSVGLGVYLFNATQEIHFIYLVILLIIIKALDIKNYTYHYLMYNFYKK